MVWGKKLLLAALFALLIFFIVFYGFIIFEPGKRRAGQVVLNEPANAKLSVPTVSYIDPKRGDPHAVLSIVEWSDYQCVYCAAMETTLNQILRKYPKTQLVWKDLPNVTLHRESQNAANAARCAGRQGKFWEYHDALFADAENLGPNLYPQLAEQLGLNVQKFTTCLAGNEENAVVLRNVDEAMALGVDGTPYFFIGDLRLSGQTSPEELEAVIQKAQSLIK